MNLMRIDANRPPRRSRITKVLAGAVLVTTLTASTAACAQSAQPPVDSTAEPEPLVLTPRILPNCPIRLGGVFTSGLSQGTKRVAAGDANDRLSTENRIWIAENCDVVALSPSSIEPDAFPAICREQKLFTPLLYLYASSLYEGPHRGSVGGWRPEMSAWTLRRGDGAELPYPDAGGHWMDFASTEWAQHWCAQARLLTDRYGAFGVIAAELPLGNTFVGNDLQKYRTPADRAAATRTWLGAVRQGYPNLLIPSALGFDLAAGHPTPVPEIGMAEPSLGARLWNDYFAVSDGAWCEGWVQPYWDRRKVSESLWETQLEAADRAGRLGQAFIVGAAYQNDADLEFALASYLLIVHHQGRVVFQPMPVRPGEPIDAGFNLAVLKREVAQRPRYFRPDLGVGMQERHEIPADGGPVWRRNFQFGDVYVNSSEHNTVTVRFAGNMRRVSGKIVRDVTLPPLSGAVLLYTAPTGNSPTGAARSRSKLARPKR